MKLLNLTSRYFAIALLIIIPIWAAIFYYTMLDEIYDSIDDGLDNQKGLIVRKAEADSTLLYKFDFDEGDYAIKETSPETALGKYDEYTDTLMYMENEKSEEPVRMLTTYFQRNDRYFQLKIVTSMVEEDDLLRHLLYSLIWLYGGLVITIVILNSFLLRRIWKPFQKLLTQLKSYRLDKPEPVITTHSKVEEFNNLNDTVRKLLDRNVNIYTGQKQFVENASHELQTPLAISIAKLETLAGDPSLSEDQLKLVSSAMDNLDRLTRLNKSLLLLSKIGNQQFPGVEQIAFNDLIKKIVEDFRDQADYSRVSIEVEDKGICSSSMNPDLALIMMTNLIKNAIVHNRPGGKARIVINQKSIIVENDGSENPLDGERIFERFHTGNTGRGTMGLGLALVKAIAENSGISVSYHFTGMHQIIVKFS